MKIWRLRKSTNGSRLAIRDAIEPRGRQFNKALKRVDDDRGSRLTFELSGKLIPWDSIRQMMNLTKDAR